MKKVCFTVIVAVWSTFMSFSQSVVPANWAEDRGKVMSEEYWKIWNPQIQAQIDRNIEQYRKSDGIIQVPANVKVKVEQLSHSFIFGGNIFLFGQLQTEAHNQQYEKTFVDLFNAATIPFYWKTLEPEKGKPRYEANSSYIFRRPPTDPIVDFCNKYHILAKGHAIIYGMRRYGHPVWMPEDRIQMEHYFEQHIRELAVRYKERIQMWDVVNEPIDQANRGLMPDDYTYKCFKWAMEYFSPSVIFNLNDIDMHGEIPYIRRYVEIVRNLIDRDVRIDNVGGQMHIFNPDEARRIAAGDSILTPEHLWSVIDCLRETDRPVHVSEVTICAPDSTQKGKMIQAVLVRNLYRLWFSEPGVTGITWWNIVDGGGAAGEPSFSGLYDVDMNKKPAYKILDELINHEWKTELTVKSDQNGFVRFRGFKGKYKLSWEDDSGKIHFIIYHLK